MANEIKNIRDAVGSNRLCRCRLSGLSEGGYYYVLAANEYFFLAAREEDFMLNGYEIRLVSDLKEAEYVDSVISDILTERGVPQGIVDPQIDLSSYSNIFGSLFFQNKMIFLESTDGERNFFDYGKILRVGRQSLILLPFDENGLWMEDVEVFYEDITGVTFGDRYNVVWQEYLERRARRAKKDPVSFTVKLLAKWNPAGLKEDGLDSEFYRKDGETVCKLLKKSRSYPEFCLQFEKYFDGAYQSIKRECTILETLWLEVNGL